MAVDVEIAGSSSLDSMDEPDVLNEGTRDEDEVKTEHTEVENVGASQVREGGHHLCVAADQGQMVMPTPKGAIPYIALARRKADERLMLALIRLALISSGTVQNGVIDDITDKIVQGMSKDAGKNDQRLQSQNVLPNR
jgi:hypothetical protein